MFVMITCISLMQGVKREDVVNLEGWRKELATVLMRSAATLCLLLTGYMGIDTEHDEKIDYKEYLGPDWKAEWDGAPTIIANHTSWLDIMYQIHLFFPGFVARSTVE